MEEKNCSVCGRVFRPYYNQPSRKCPQCVLKQSAINAELKLKDYHSPSKVRQIDIDEAIELLSKIGYDVQGDVYQQFVVRAREKYGITF